MMGSNAGWPSMGAGPLLWMLAAILVVAGLAVLVAWATSGRGAPAEDEALGILRARYARGEIDAEAFATAKSNLGLGSPQEPPSRSTLRLGVAVLVTAVLLGGLAWISFGGFGGMMGPGMMGMMGPVPTAPPGTSATMAGARFTPPEIDIKVGETVRWFNDDAIPHTVTAADRRWDSGNMPPGGAFERRFDAGGTYAYVCLYHAWMTGTVVVTAR